MKWTTERPKVKGFYWVAFKHGISDPHHQGPMVFEVSFDEDVLDVCEPGGDYIRSIETYEEQNEVSVEFWSDEPIQLPEGEWR